MGSPTTCSRSHAKRRPLRQVTRCGWTSLPESRQQRPTWTSLRRRRYPVAGDDAALERALGNLVENARAYGPVGGRISVSVRRRGASRVLLSVADEGLGRKAEGERAFERFWRGRAGPAGIRLEDFGSRSSAPPPSGTGAAPRSTVRPLPRFELPIFRKASEGSGTLAGEKNLEKGSSLKKLRTLSTARLVTLIVAVTVVLVAGGAVAAAVARGGSGATPPPEPLAQAIHEGLAAGSRRASPRTRVHERALPFRRADRAERLGVDVGRQGAALADSTGGRLELQSSSGDVQMAGTTRRRGSPTRRRTPSTGRPAAETLRPNTRAAQFRRRISETSSAARRRLDGLGCDSRPTSPAGRRTRSRSRRAATVACSARPSSHGTRQRRAARDRDLRARRVPPALALARRTSPTGPCPLRHRRPRRQGRRSSTSPRTTAARRTGSEAPVTGLANVQAQAGFTVVAPDAIAGRARQNARLVGRPASAPLS